MIVVRVGVTDVNSTAAVVVAWFVADGDAVAAGDLLCEAETTKAVVEVRAPAAGHVARLAPEGAAVALDGPVATLHDTAEEARAAAASTGAPPDRGTARAATRPAAALAARLGIDLAAVPAAGLVTVADVEAAAALAAGPRPDPLAAPPGHARLLIVGAGLGATQVADILVARGGPATPIAIADDDPARWGAEVAGLPVVGGLAEALALDAFDAAVIAISTSIAARTRLRAALAAAGLPLASAIDPTVRLGRGSHVGAGSVLCAFCHLGVEARVGENSFLSAYTSVDHHGAIGDDCSTGPGCLLSGCAVVGDRVRLGSGIVLQPHVVVGDDAMVASGAVLTGPVPAGHAVKTRVETTVIVPVRRAA